MHQRAAARGVLTLRAVLGLVFVLLLAASLRLPSLGHDSLWNNEVLSYQRATQPSLAEAYAMIRQGTHPPLYALAILRPLSKLVDLDERLQRLPSALFGLLTVALVFGYAARAFNTRVAVYAALLLGVLPMHVYYSREGRMYALLALLCMLWLACLSRALKHDHWPAWLGFAVFGAASLYTHYYAGLTLAAVCLVAAGILLAQSKWATLARFVGWQLLLVLLFAPWLPTLWYQLHNDPVSHLQAMSLPQVVQLPVQFFTAFVPVPLVVKAVCAAAVAVLGIAAMDNLRKSRGHPPCWRQELLLLLAAVLGTLGFAALISVVKPILFVRYLVGVLPFLCIVLAVGVTSLRPRWLASTALGGLLVIGLSCSVLTLQGSWRPNFKDPLALVEQAGGAQQQLLLFAPDADSLHLLAFEHYFRSTLPLSRHYGASAGSDQLENVLRHISPKTETIWVLQVQLVRALPEHVPGFRKRSEHLYPSRFFTARLDIGLAAYERVPEAGREQP